MEIFKLKGNDITYMSELIPPFPTAKGRCEARKGGVKFALITYVTTMKKMFHKLCAHLRWFCMVDNMLPQEIKSRYEKASMAVEKKNYDYAIQLLTEAISIKPDFAKARQLIRVAEIKKFEEKAPNIITSSIKRLFSFFRMPWAMINEIKGDHSAAMIAYEKILRNDPKNVWVLVRLAHLLKIDGMKEASAVTLEVAISLSKKNAIAYELLGEVYSDLGDYGHARYCFKKVLELKPHDANAERGIKNLDALTTIDKSFEEKDSGDFRIREIKE